MVTEQKTRFLTDDRRGLTLVELLVAITILTIVTALIVPRVRIINKERNIRETARVVGSAFNLARDNAVAQGVSGLLIQRNPNFLETTAAGNRVLFAGTRLIQLRAVPPYTGNSFEERVVSIEVDESIQRIVCQIQEPFEPNTIGVGDSIRFGNRTPIYRIQALGELVPTNTPGILARPLVLDWDDNADPTDGLRLQGIDYRSGFAAPPIVAALDNINLKPTFEVVRLPRPVNSSRLDLPSGYLIDLRYSGPLDDGMYEANHPGIGSDDPETQTVFGWALAANEDPSLPLFQEIRVYFNRRGAIDRIVSHGIPLLAGSSLDLFISEFDVAVHNPTVQLTSEERGLVLLSNPDSLWLTVGLNGGINVGYNAAPPAGSLAEMIVNARRISRLRTSAFQ